MGREFVGWAEGLGVDLTERNVRYDHCLILDDTALKMLEALPDPVPEVKPRPAPSEAWRELVRIIHGAWAWILDRQTMQDCLARTPRRSLDDIHPPWMRIRLSRLYCLWFYRA